jgi:AcrR family transcriptional regulator
VARHHRSEPKKERILQAALQLFAEKGYHATTTKEIAAACGVAEGLLFYYFGGKRELLLSVVRKFSFLETVRESVGRLEHLSREEALVEYGKLYLGFLADHKHYLLLIWSPDMMRDEEVNSEVTRLLAGMAEQGGRVLARTAGGTEPLGDRTVEAAVSMLLSSLLTYFLIGERMNRRNPEEDEAYIRETVGILLHGIAPAVA